MPNQNRIVKPGRKERTVFTESGEVLMVPAGWELLAPGDGPLTKLVKTKGISWLVQVKFKNRFISKGIWTKSEHILAATRELADKRAAPGYQKKQQQALVRREKKQVDYREEFYTAVILFLNFDARYEALAKEIASLVTDHATPVGSGTVARTERIPLEDRAGSAVIAWLRHQTTAYDKMAIARVKGRRREVRRELAARSKQMLQLYRQGVDIPSTCPLQNALTMKN